MSTAERNDPMAPTTELRPLPARTLANLQAVLEDSLRHASLGVTLGLEAPWMPRLVLTAGSSGPDGDPPITRDNLFQVGSQTKMFTAACALTLVRQGRLDLGMPVRAVIGEAYFGEDIRLGHLLNHTSGLGNPSVLIDPINRVVDYPLSFQERLFLARVKGAASEPGTAWEYNNLGYWLVEEMIARAGGEPYAEQLRRLVLDPLGLRDTFVGSLMDYPVERMARGFHVDRSGRRVETTHHPCLAEAGAAGDLVSSVDDMMTWLGALCGADPRIEVSWRDLATRLTPCADGVGNAIEYGLGIQRFSVGGRDCWGHGGAMCGYMTMGLVEPRSGLRLCMMSNKVTRPVPSWTALQMMGFHVVSMIVRMVLEHEPDRP